MKNKNILVSVVLIIVLGALLFLIEKIDKNQNKDESNTQTYITETYVLEKEGISFEYKTNPDGYVIEDVTSLAKEQIKDGEVVSAYTIMNAREKQELESSEQGREAPPTIAVTVYKNNNNQSASMWVDSFPMLSNISLIIGEANRDAIVAGANAVYYKTDGLYQSQNYVIAHGGYTYQFVGSYLDENSDIYKDFNSIINSIKFIPVPENNLPNIPQAKIDVSVACQSALVYMTFNSGEEADVFVSECIEGKHPDVIERYIRDLGLDGASI